jgi:hypothetical protein
MPIMTASIDDRPLFKYEEKTPKTTAELIAVVEATADENAISVERLIMNAMTDVLCDKVVLDDGAGAFEKYCISYLILTEPVPPPKGTNCTKTIAEWLTASDFRVNILSQEDGNVLEIARDAIKKHL